MTDERWGEQVIEVGDLRIDLARRLVHRSGEVIALTRTEWILLEYMAANAGKVMLSTELLTCVWGPEYEGDRQYLRMWISRLRRKLESGQGEPTVIKTMYGIGYMLDAEPQSAGPPATG